MLVMSIVIFNNYHVVPRLFCALIAVIVLTISVLLFHRGHVNVAASLTMFSYFTIAIVAAVIWTVNTPFAILMFGFVILLGGSFFGSIAILPTALCVIFTLTIIQSASILGFVVSSTDHFSTGSSFADVLGYSILLSVFGLIGWLSGRDIENTMSSLIVAKRKLERHNEYIRSELHREKEKLRLAQIEELTTLYRFAEIGRKSTLLLHTLANHVTELSLSMPEHSEEKFIHESRKTIKSIGNLINLAQEEIKPSQSISFKVSGILRNVIERQSPLAIENNVKINLSIDNAAEASKVYGDRIQLLQAIEVIVGNAIQAYAETPKKKSRQIHISHKIYGGKIVIDIQDFAGGIPRKIRDTLFNATLTTKKNGHGVGLYVSHQIIHHHFNGELSMVDDHKSTIFRIKIPLGEVKSTDNR